ncbi:MAG: hypothetical protein MUC66_06570 [Methanolinea sp.]|jgi:hypothetical protein|nr:hypothetical protein [Methanolinea sp.]
MLPYPVRILLLALLLLSCMGFPASALLAPGNVQVQPPGDALLEGAVVNVSADIEIIPSGATTFAETHTLSLSTGLLEARWQVVVIVDGLQAAVIPKEGPQVYVNGFLLSYPTTRDVSVRLLLEGRVPPTPVEGTVMVLQWAELNAQGQAVTGSEYQVTRQVATTLASPPSTFTEQPSVPVASPTKAAFPMIAVIASLCLVFALMRMRKE